MDTFTIVPHARAGTYQVVATAGDGKRTILATYQTEQAAVARLRRLQEKSGVVQLREARNWRG